MCIRPVPLLATALICAATAAASSFAGECVPGTIDESFGAFGMSGTVLSLTTHDDGSGAGEQLYAGGTFGLAGGVLASRVAKWDGSSWSALGAGVTGGENYDMVSHNGDLFAAGYFTSAGGVVGTAKLAGWDGENWYSLGALLESGLNQLWALESFDDGSGQKLYIGGNYSNIGGPGGPAYLSRWDGKSFETVGETIGGAVPLIIFDMQIFDDGNGPALYAGGRFITIGGITANHIAKWNGKSWEALGTGLAGAGVATGALAMTVWDDGNGPALYVGGQSFTSAGGVPANRIAKWDGNEWSALGDGLADGIVWHLESFDDGSGDALYAIGTFENSGTTPISRVAKWDGTSWSPIGTGLDNSGYSVLTFDDGNGESLFVGGNFLSLDGTTANRIARIDGCPDDAPVGDLNGDDVVGFTDLLIVLDAWGPCNGACPADLDRSGSVGFEDLLIVLDNWS